MDLRKVDNAINANSARLNQMVATQMSTMVLTRWVLAPETGGEPLCKYSYSRFQILPRNKLSSHRPPMKPQCDLFIEMHYKDMLGNILRNSPSVTLSTSES